MVDYADVWEKTKTFKDLNKDNPERIIEEAVKGMLPKNKLGREIIGHLRVYKDNIHHHEAQNPVKWSDA